MDERRGKEEEELLVIGYKLLGVGDTTIFLFFQAGTFLRKVRGVGLMMRRFR
jgi:hypothetical protein